MSNERKWGPMNPLEAALERELEDIRENHALRRKVESLEREVERLREIADLVMARRGDERGYMDPDTMKWTPVDMVADITPRGNIISETYREYVEWREQGGLVDGSELRRRVEGRIAMREGRSPFRGTILAEIRIFRKVLRMLDELEREKS